MSIRFDRRKHVIPEIFFLSYVEFRVTVLNCMMIKLNWYHYYLFYLMCEKLFVDYFWCVCLLLFLIFVPFLFFNGSIHLIHVFNTILSYLFKSLIIVRCFINFSSITSNKLQIYYTYNELSQFKPNHYICPLTEI